MQVSDAQIAYDIVLRFYGIEARNPEWKYVLETFKCRDYFALDNDITKLYNLTVPEEGFDLLLDVLKLYDIMNDRKLIRLIKKNLPTSSNLQTL
jgi:hypothetical protein